MDQHSGTVWRAQACGLPRFRRQPPPCMGGCGGGRPLRPPYPWPPQGPGPSRPPQGPPPGRPPQGPWPLWPPRGPV